MKIDHSLAAPYVLDSLNDEERAAYEEHVAGCARCREEIARLEAGLVAMAVSHSVSPPPELRERVLGAVEERSHESADVPTLLRRRLSRNRRFWIPGVAAAAAVIIIAVFSLGGGTNPVEEIAGAPDAVTVAFSPTDAYASDVPEVSRVIYSERRGAGAVEFDGLPQLPPGLIYELWLVPEAGPSPAGLFNPDESGSASVALEGRVGAGLVVALTVEPEGGSLAPTGEILFVAQL